MAEAAPSGSDPRAPQRPALRDLQVEPTHQDGREGVALSDPLGIAVNAIFVPAGLLPVVGRFDGSRTLAEIEAELRESSHAELPRDLVSGLARQFEELLLLDTPRFREALDRAKDEFANRAIRAAAHAGITAGYPEEPIAARDALESMVRRPTEDLRPTPRGLIAPHIDLARGREGYALAYSALAECEPADLYVVFGTGHQGPQAPVTGLAMDWDTPAGTVETDHEFVAAIHGKLGPPHPADLLLHRREHSLEFQMLFLRHVLGDRPAKVAGFLTGALLHAGGSIDDEPLVQMLLSVFSGAVEERRRAGQRVCFVAGADLAHIGPFFGDPQPMDPDRLEHLADSDLRRLKHLERGDPGAFFHAVEDDGNPDRVCGTTPMFLTASLATHDGRLLHYGQAGATDGQQAVSYCSMIFD